MHPGRISTLRRAGRATAGLVLAASLVPALPASVDAAAPTLFVSEYVHGTGLNQALEIYNPTAATVDLAGSGYAIKMYFNGFPMAGLTIGLTGSIGPGETYVISREGADPALISVADQLHDPVEGGWFNGDDAVALTRDDVLVDVIGRIGEDPGAAWGVSPTRTVDQTLRRKPEIVSGDADGSDPFDPSVEWIGFPRNTFSGLGTHTVVAANADVVADCGGPVTVPHGAAADVTVTATDPDGTVTSLSIGGVTPVDPGTIGIGTTTPAAGAGGTATAEVTVGAETPAGNYGVTIDAANDDPAPQGGSCVLDVTVEAAAETSPPTPSGIDGLRALLHDLVTDGSVHDGKARLLIERLDRVARFIANDQPDAADAQLRAFANQAQGFAPRWIEPGAAEALASAADAAAAAD